MSYQITKPRKNACYSWCTLTNHRNEMKLVCSFNFLDENIHI